MMMNPELMRLAQEQMSRMSPSVLARMQQQIMANPDLIKIASENIKNMRTEDFERAGQQLNQTSPEEMLDMIAKIASAKPEEFAAMKAQADAQMSYAVSGAKMLKQQGNELHGRGRYADAAAKYKLAKDNLKNIPLASAAGQTLQSQCAVNLMACYLKTGKFVECVNEGSEVLSYDASNVKAYYRRGQAYKELGNLEAAVSDLSKAQGICPEDKTIAEVLRDAEEKLAMEGGEANLPSKGVVIEEIVEEDASEPSSTDQRSSSSGYSVSDPLEGAGNSAQSESLEDLRNDPVTVNLQEAMRKSMKDPAMRQMMASTMKNMSPDLLEMMSEQFGMKLSKKDAAKAQQAMSSLSQGDLDRMMNLVDRAQQGVEIAKKTKNWLFGRKGLVLPIAMLAVAFILHWLGF
ncbi:outer envelope protein 61 [Brachypodium distachyon]|uniref:outer envelope protein 61 n=1 Tax=Brachypodium distachyon TaxID=15368 RepID=UPI0001C723E6|nr:outer envelope protein 61 [Brachypodium distachyon]|eukprot:XP_003566303.2 outer envelope protein 61 [Brachypodium distachyon]